MKGNNSNKKHLLMGIIIGIIIGVAVTYLLLMSGMMRPFMFGDLARNGNFTGNFSNFTRPMRNAAGVP